MPSPDTVGELTMKMDSYMGSSTSHLSLTFPFLERGGRPDPVAKTDLVGCVALLL